MMIVWRKNNTEWGFSNQYHFNNFNWNNFIRGDIVWLEDYEGTDFDNLIAGVYAGMGEYLDNIVIELLPDIAARHVARHSVENISELKGKYWESLQEKIFAYEEALQ